jgi:DNA-binding beta-propeller fold protein YncE
VISRARVWRLAWALGVGWHCAAIGAAAPIPVDQRLTGEGVRTLRGPATDPLRMPTDVAVAADGTIFVADGVNDRVVRFSAQGVYRGPLETGQVALHNPLGLTVDGKNQLWIVQGGRNEIIVTASTGRLRARVKLPAVAGDPVDPTDVAVDANGTATFIVDNDHHRILVRDNASGTFSAFGESGTALGQMQWPFMIALDTDGNAYVTEAIGARVQRLNAQRLWLPPIGRWGVELGQLYRPKGVAIDAKQRVWVSDSTTGAIQVFDRRGRVLAVLTDEAGSVLRFDGPMGMAFSPTGELLVVESGADQVRGVRFPRGAAPDQAAGEEDRQP